LSLNGKRRHYGLRQRQVGVFRAREKRQKVDLAGEKEACVYREKRSIEARGIPAPTSKKVGLQP